ncbi:hypothetical protein [Haliangium sp.]|uniref:hypothetical protein n=1 Tax=Haliangium sp. TaxID=2663208 RepID=UPI003D125E51
MSADAAGTERSAAGAAAPTRSIEIDDLVEMSLVDLVDLYSAGTVPASVAALDRAEWARLLAVRGLDWAPARAWLARLAGARRFPWRGKRFRHEDRNQGRGSNRLALVGERELLLFRTRVEESAIDTGPCITLDYDLPDNAAPVRLLRDELREVSPGLYLGLVTLRGLGRPRLLAGFACDQQQPRR